MMPMDTATQPWADLSLWLRPGERLLWAGRPDPAVHFVAGDLYLLP